MNEETIDFEMRVRQAEKSLFGNHLARDIMQRAEEVFLLYGSHGGPGFSDENYTLAEITLPGGQTHYFINTDGNYKRANMSSDIAEHTATNDYRYIRRNRALEKVLREAPSLLHNEEAKQYLTAIIGDPRDDRHYISKAEICEGELTGEQFSVVKLLPTNESGAGRNIYFSSFSGSPYRRADRDYAEKLISIATRELPRIPKIPRESRKISPHKVYLTGENGVMW